MRSHLKVHSDGVAGLLDLDSLHHASVAKLPHHQATVKLAWGLRTRTCYDSQIDLNQCKVGFRGRSLKRSVLGRTLERSVLGRTLERRVWGGVWRRSLKEEFGKEYRRGV